MLEYHDHQASFCCLMHLYLFYQPEALEVPLFMTVCLFITLLSGYVLLKTHVAFYSACTFSMSVYNI